MYALVVRLTCVLVLGLCMYHSKDAVLEGGILFNKAYGMTAFEYHGTDPRFIKAFNRGMANHSTLTMKKLLRSPKALRASHPLLIACWRRHEHVGGDMFVSVLKGDAIFVKWICHEWSDEHYLKF
ncbi:hypothetical protein ACFX1X_041893 [Malus domestica]